MDYLKFAADNARREFRVTRAAIRLEFPDAYYVAGVGWCGPDWEKAAAKEQNARDYAAYLKGEQPDPRD